MHNKQAIYTDKAPAPSGTYSQGIKIGNTVYLAGQIPLTPQGTELVSSKIDEQVEQIFKNLSAVAEAAGGSLNHIVKLTVFLMNLSDFPVINSLMEKYFHKPYPARSTIQVAALPKGSLVEIEAVMVT